MYKHPENFKDVSEGCKKCSKKPKEFYVIGKNLDILCIPCKNKESNPKKKVNNA